MSKDIIKQSISDIVNDVLQINDSGDKNYKRHDLPSWDSLKHMELVLRLEEAFQIRMSIDQVGAIDSLEHIETVVKQCLRDAQAGANDASSD